jgi:hypothetical protein
MESIHEGVALEMNLLPPGPIWLLHSFHLVTTGLMLVWYMRYERQPATPAGAVEFGDAYSKSFKGV